MKTAAIRALIVSSLFALASCGGGGDSATSSEPAGAPAPAPSPAPAPAPSPSPAPASPASNSMLCGTPITGNPGGANESCSLSASPGSAHQGTVRPVVDICLGVANCSHLSASVRIDAAPSYTGAFTARLVSCPRIDPGRALVPDCTDAIRNDLGHLGFLEFRWDAPNGNVGPSTTFTYQVLTSTDGVGLMRCGADAFSDASHVRIDDEAGNSLFVALNVSGTSC